MDTEEGEARNAGRGPQQINRKLSGKYLETWKEDSFFPEVTERCSGQGTFERYFTVMAICLRCQLKTACCILK